jgi:hypothetical protein
MKGKMLRTVLKKAPRKDGNEGYNRHDFWLYYVKWTNISVL